MKLRNLIKESVLSVPSESVLKGALVLFLN